MNMMDKNQRLQLKVLIKTRINQVKQLLNHGELDALDKDVFKQEIADLKFNLKRINDENICVCEKCNRTIGYTYLVARPDTKNCEQCNQ